MKRSGDAVQIFAFEWRSWFKFSGARAFHRLTMITYSRKRQPHNDNPPRKKPKTTDKSGPDDDDDDDDDEPRPSRKSAHHLLQIS